MFMKPAALLLSSSLASASRRIVLSFSFSEREKKNLRSSFRSLPGILVIFFILPITLNAQNDSSSVLKSTLPDTNNVDNPANLKRFLKNNYGDANYFTLTPQQKKKRIWIVAGGNVVGYGATMIGLNSAWYKNYPRTSFHSFNDNKEWLQVDKVGHLYSAYIESRGSMEMWRWTGIDRKKRIWIGGMSGAFYQTVIEILDGFQQPMGMELG
jgi:hypothetical protein